LQETDTMKKFGLFFLLVLFGASPLLSAEEQTLLGRIEDRGEFNTTVGRATAIDGAGAILFGGSRGKLFNRVLSIGWGTYFLLPFISISGNTLYLAYTGFELGATILPDAIIHPSFHSLIGFGGALYDFDFKKGDLFFVIEPTAGVEMNITNSMRVAVGGGYRFVSGLNGMAGLDNDSLSGLALELAFKWTLSRGRLSGKIALEPRSLPYFHSIHLQGSGMAHLSQGREPSVEVRADENVIDIIKTEVRGGTLYVYTLHDITRISSFDVYVVMDEIREISVSGSGSVNGEGELNAEELTLNMFGSGRMSLSLDAESTTTRISGSGKMELAGSSEELQAKISGSGQLNARSLSTKDTRIFVSGSGTGRVAASEKLDVNISGSGDVSYSGDPVVSSRVTGSGRLWKEE
jgi:hypothetical protein